MAAPDVKDEIDAQSGRFEFFKQALTLGLAGLAGTAAFFTDTTKIPADTWSIVAISAIGVALLVVVGSSLMGLSVYANLLKASALGDPVADFRKSMILHAQWVFVSIAVTALALVGYAGLQLANRHGTTITSVEALGLSRKAIAATGCDAQVESLGRQGKFFQLTYESSACRRRYKVMVEREGGEIALTSFPVPGDTTQPVPGRSLNRAAAH